MWGVMVDPDPTHRAGKWFLHICTHEDQTFQYNPNHHAWYSFNTKEEAQAWLRVWYNQRRAARRWMPTIDRFEVVEIPNSPIVDTITKDVVNNIVETENTFRMVD